MPTTFLTWCFIKIRVLVNIIPGAYVSPTLLKAHCVFPLSPTTHNIWRGKEGHRVFLDLSFETTVWFAPLHFIQNPILGYLAIKHSLISRLVRVQLPAEQWFLLFLPGLWATYAIKRERPEVSFVNSVPKWKTIIIIWNLEREIKIKLKKRIPKLEETIIYVTRMKMGCDAVKFMNSHHMVPHMSCSVWMASSQGSCHMWGTLRFLNQTDLDSNRSPVLLLSVSLIFKNNKVLPPTK